MQSMALSALVCSLAQLALYGARSVKRISVMVFPWGVSLWTMGHIAQNANRKFGNSNKNALQIKNAPRKGCCGLLFVLEFALVLKVSVA